MARRDRDGSFSNRGSDFSILVGTVSISIHPPVSVLYRLPTTETAAKMSNSRPKRRGNRTKSNG